MADSTPQSNPGNTPQGPPMGAPGTSAPDAGTNTADATQNSGKQYYAWSRFPVKITKSGKVQYIGVGDPISKSNLDDSVSDADWENLIAEGAVRTTKYPSAEKLGTMSPSEYFRKQLVDAAEGNLSDDEVAELVS